MPDDDPTVRSVGAVVHDYPVRSPSVDAAGVGPHDRPRALRGWRGARERSLDTSGQSSSDAIVTVLVAGEPVVMQAIDQTNPASSRAITVTTTCLSLPFAIM
jgi:hypothetical protein